MATTITANQFWTVASIFSSTGLYPKTEATVLSFLEQAEIRVARDLWGEKADYGVIYLAAHLLHLDVLLNNTPIIQSTSNQSGGQTLGAIASMSVGPVSVSYAASGVMAASGEAAFANDVLATTPWGKRFIEIRSELMLRGTW